MAFQNCVVCGKRQDGLLKLLPHFKSEKEYKYIHKKCLLFYNSDWSNRLAVNERLFYKDYLKHCSICDKKAHQQVVRCAQSSCSKRFHLDCLVNPVIKVNYEQKHRHAWLLIYCPDHQTIYESTPNLEREIESLYYTHIESQEQSRHKKKHKKKHSKSRSQRKRSRHSSPIFSDGELSKSNDSISHLARPVKKPQELLIMPQSFISNDVMQEVLKMKRNESEVPQEEQEQIIQVPQQLQPIITQPKSVEKQQIFPNTNKQLDDPEFPWSEREAKRDSSIIKWWQKVDEVYFRGEEKMPLTKCIDFSDPFGWYDLGLDQELLNSADSSNFGISFIKPRTNNLTQILVQRHRQCNLSIVTIFLVVHQLQKSISFIRYSFTEHLGRTTSQGELQTNLRLYRFPQESVPICSFVEKESVGKSLLFLESCELTQDEYEECLSLEQSIIQQQTVLEQQLDIDSETVQNLDIAYHILKDQLNDLVQSNNNTREYINNQLNTYNIKIVNEEQQLLMDLLKWSQIVRAFINGYKDKGEDVLNTFYPCLTQQSSQKAQLKKKKLHSKENTKPLDTDCKICFDYHYTDFNPVIYCGKCSTSFHKICYGFSGPLDEDDVICDACQFETQKLSQNRRGAKCRICKKLGLPQKYIRSQFYHVSCLLLTNQVILQDGTYEVRNRKNNIKQFCKDNETSTPQCAVCGDSKGYRFTCCGTQEIPCRHAFHPLCAYLHGLEIDIESEDLEQCCKEQRFAQLNVRIKCVLHCGKSLQDLLLQTYYRRFALNYEQTAKCGGEEDFMEGFKKTKGFRQQCFQNNLRYLSLKQPISKNDSLLSQIYNQNGTPTPMM